MKSKTLLEKNFQRRVNRDLKRLKNTWAYHPSDRAKKGIPDLLLCVNGIFVALELKRSAQEKATPLQKDTLNKICEAQGDAWVVNPENWDDIFQILLSHSGGLK